MSSTQNIQKNGRALSDLEYANFIEFTEGRGWRRTRDRVGEYFRADKTQEILLQMSTVGKPLTLGCTLTGASVGLFAGPEGALIGGTIGFGVGIILTFTYGSVQLRRNYVDWKKSCGQIIFIDKFKEIHVDHPYLQNFLCPIREEIFTEPAVTLCGHTFEKLNLEQWIVQEQEANRVPSCPMCRAAVTLNELSVDILMIGRMKKIYAKIANEEKLKPTYSDAIVNAFQAMSEDMNYQATETLKQVTTQLTLALTKGKISSEVFFRKMREIDAAYEEKI